MTRSIEMSPTSTRYLRTAGWSFAAILLLLPAIAMQVTTGVDWSVGDFVFAGIVFALVGGLLELAARASANIAFRLGAACAVFTAFLTVWINAAVGIVGEPDNPLNLVYFAILAIAAASATTAGRNAGRLGRAMLATAAFQALVCLVHLLDRVEPALLIDAFFALTWLVSGLLFKRAANQAAIKT